MLISQKNSEPGTCLLDLDQNESSTLNYSIFVVVFVVEEFCGSCFIVSYGRTQNKDQGYANLIAQRPQHAVPDAGQEFFFLI